MKEKILTLIIGALIGAIITTGVFLIINKNNDNTNQMQNGRTNMMRNGEFNPENMKGGKGQKNVDSNSTQNSEDSLKDDMKEPPEMPDGEAPMENNQDGNQSSGKMKNKNTPQGGKNSSNSNQS